MLFSFKLVYYAITKQIRFRGVPCVGGHPNLTLFNYFETTAITLLWNGDGIFHHPMGSFSCQDHTNLEVRIDTRSNT